MNKTQAYMDFSSVVTSVLFDTANAITELTNIVHLCSN